MTPALHGTRVKITRSDGKRIIARAAAAGPAADIATTTTGGFGTKLRFASILKRGITIEKARGAGTDDAGSRRASGGNCSIRGATTRGCGGAVHHGVTVIVESIAELNVWLSTVFARPPLATRATLRPWRALSDVGTFTRACVTFHANGARVREGETGVISRIVACIQREAAVDACGAGACVGERQHAAVG
jgi:hypothetical protein